MPIKDVGFNPEVNLRLFYKIDVNFSANVIFPKLQSLRKLLRVQSVISYISVLCAYL